MSIRARDEHSFAVQLDSLDAGVWQRLTHWLSALGGRLWQRLAKPPRRIDPHRVAQAVLAVMDRCEDKDVRGQRLMWNDYRIFLSQEDFDVLAPLVTHLQQDLASLVQERFSEGDATLVGGINVDLLVSEGERLPSGTIVVQGSFLAYTEQTTEHVAVGRGGPVTVRTGRKTAKPPPQPSATRRVADPVQPGKLNPVAPVPLAKHSRPLRIRWLDREAVVDHGSRVVLGRPHIGSKGGKGSFVPLHGASDQINRRQLFIEPTADGGALVGRLSDANAVVVGGRLLVEGGQIAVATLPIEVALSGDALMLRIEVAAE